MCSDYLVQLSLLKEIKKAALMCCTKYFLETECEKEWYLAILKYLGYNYKNAVYPGFICQKRNIDLGNAHIQYYSGLYA